MALEGRFSCPVLEGTKHSLMLVDSYCLLFLPCVGAVSCGPGGQVLLSCLRRDQAQPHAGGQLLCQLQAHNNPIKSQARRFFIEGIFLTDT